MVTLSTLVPINPPAAGGGGGTGGVPDDGSVTNAKLAFDAVTTDKILDGTIQTVDLADQAVTSLKIKDGTIVNADVAPAAAIATTKLSPDPLARANHTGTQLAATISDFDAAAAAAAGPGAGVPASTWDAASIVKADVDNTPVALPVPASTLVGRGAAGPIAALTPAQAKALLAIVAGDVGGLGSLATASAVTDAEITGPISTAKLSPDPRARATHTGTQLAATVSDLGALATKSTIANADVAAGAAIALSKLAVDPLARANHTGTQLAATVSDFNTAVRTNRLDQMAAPTAPVNLGGQIATNGATPVAGTDLATKAYADTKGLPAANSGWGVTPGYTQDKTFNPEATTVTEVARVLGTLIDVLKTAVILAS